MKISRYSRASLVHIAPRTVTSRKVNALIDIAFHDIFSRARLGRRRCRGIVTRKRAMSASGSLFCLRIGSMKAQLVRDDEPRIRPAQNTAVPGIPNDDANNFRKYPLEMIFRTLPKSLRYRRESGTIFSKSVNAG